MSKMNHSDPDFIFKINRYLDNPYKFTLQEICADFAMNEEDVLKAIFENEYLHFKYKSILFSRRTTAEELYQSLLTAAPSYNSKSDFTLQMENPAFNVSYSFYINDLRTVDYFKLEYEKKLAPKEIKNLLLSYINKSPALVKELQIHLIQLNRASLDDFSSYTIMNMTYR